MTGMIVTPVAGSMAGALLRVMSDTQAALPLNVGLACLAGGLAGCVLTRLRCPVSALFQTEP